MPPGPLPEPGDVECKPRKENGFCRCGRTWATDCTCEYYKRTTTFVDVLQSEFALKQWDQRMVAYGMGQRPDLVVAAAACRNDGSKFDNDKLQAIAKAAKDHARQAASANIGTALHTFTEWMDTGQELGVVPDPYPADLAAYAVATKDIEWAAVETFRVHDTWKVAGTADRVGRFTSGPYADGRWKIFDLKTSPKENPISYPHGPAMQLGMYANMLPYNIATDERGENPPDFDYDTGYIIMLPAGKAHCTIRPIDIGAGYRACATAVTVWDWRNNKDLILDDGAQIEVTIKETVAHAQSAAELRILWQAAANMGQLTDELRELMLSRAAQLKEHQQ